MKLTGFLSRRSLTALLPLTVLLLLLIGLWIIYQTEQRYRTNQLSATEVQAKILAASVTAPVDFGDQTAAQESVEALRLNPLVQMAGIYDANGVRFAGYSRAQALPSRLHDVVGSDKERIKSLVPIVRRGSRIGTVYLVGTIDPLSRRLSRYAMVALLVVMTLMVLAVLGFGQMALHRVNRTLAEANRELRFQMEERAHAEEQLREAQKMQALGQLTGGIAHDFNNLLAVIQGSSDMLLRPGLTEQKRTRFTNAIIEAAARAAQLTGQLLAFARRQPLKPELLDVNDRIRTMLDMIQPTLGPNIAVHTELQEDLWAVDVDPGQLEAAVLNIMVNARDAMPHGGEITIRTSNLAGEQASPRNRAVRISISDSGSGIAPDQLKRVFEPFFTTKTVGKGTGLGLSQVYGFAAQSGGEAQITSELDKGTTVTLLLPARDRPLPAPAPVDTSASAREQSGRILVVEDNEAVGNLVESLLGELGHVVVRARSGPEALSISERGVPFDIVFSDVVMPGMSGVELAGKLKQRRPQLPIILTTGYSEGLAAASSQDFPVLRKPYRMEALANAVDQALATHRSH